MFIPTPSRRAIHEAIFADGVLVAVKDLNLGHHFQLKNIPNLHVVKAMQVRRADILRCTLWKIAF